MREDPQYHPLIDCLLHAKQNPLQFLITEQLLAFRCEVRNTGKGTQEHKENAVLAHVLLPCLQLLYILHEAVLPILVPVLC